MNARVRELEQTGRMAQAADDSQRCYDRCLQAGFLPVRAGRLYDVLNCLVQEDLYDGRLTPTVFPLLSTYGQQTFHFSVESPTKCWCCAATCTLIAWNATVRGMRGEVVDMIDGGGSGRCLG